MLGLCKESGKLAHVAFLDIKAAYDSVPRAVLWQRCESVGIDPLVIVCLQAPFDHNSAILEISQKRSTPFSLPVGVLQGSVLSPLLYFIYLDPLVEKLQENGPSIHLPHNGGKINCLLYALVAASASGLRKLLELASEDSIARGYRFSPAKCVVVVPGKAVYRVYGNAIPRQRSFCFLGIELCNVGIKAKDHVARRIVKAEKVASLLAQFGARFKAFLAKVSICLYQTFIRPGLEYGLPVIGDYSPAISLLNKCQKRILLSPSRP